MKKKLIILLITVAFLFLLGEGVLRYLRCAWPFEKELYRYDYLTERDATLRWRYSSAEGRNSLGLRNREVEPKARGTFRILFLGDSLVWSGETRSGALYTEVLEDRLNDSAADRKSAFEVINAGIPGYTTFQELEFLKIYGLEMEPDLVILGFVFNDVYYKYLHKPTKAGMLDTAPEVYLYRFDPNAFPGVLFARSYLAHEFVRRIRALWKKITGAPAFPFDHRADFHLAWKDYGWIHPRMVLSRMQKLLKEKGIPLLVVSFPVVDQVNDQYRKLDEEYVLYPQKMLRAICDAHAIPLLDLTETIYRNGAVELYNDYLHLNPKGNEVIAGAILRFVEYELHH